MADKQKRMTRRELKAPDRFELMLKSAWERVERHWKLLVAGVAGLIVAGIAATMVSNAAERARTDRADAFSEALQPVMAPVGDEADSEKLPDSIADEKSYASWDEARAAAVDELSAFLDEHGDASAAVAARFLRGALKEQGHEARAKAMQEFLSENPPVLQPSARLVLADARAGAGQRDAAMKAYRKLAEEHSGELAALAWMGVGDLRHPLLEGDGEGADEAREAYEKAREALGPKPSGGGMMAGMGGGSWMHTALDNKLALAGDLGESSAASSGEKGGSGSEGAASGSAEQ